MELKWFLSIEIYSAIALTELMEDLLLESFVITKMTLQVFLILMMFSVSRGGWGAWTYYNTHMGQRTTCRKSVLSA